MKISFYGWSRSVTGAHTHVITPVTYDGNTYIEDDEEDQPLGWHTSQCAFGRIEDLSLNGAFLVKFEWDDIELKNWLKKFVAEKPEAAIGLLAEMQAEAVLALFRKNQINSDKQ